MPMQNRRFPSHLYPKNAYAAPSVPPVGMMVPQQPVQAMQDPQANGYQTPNFHTYATPAGRMASGLGYNDPVVAQYMAQQQRNAMTPAQQAYVDATPKVMANRMAGEIPPGPRSPQEAAINNVGGTYSATASDATKAVYQAAAQRQAARAAAYKALVAQRYGGKKLPMQQGQPGQASPSQVAITYGPNGMNVAPASSLPAQSTPGVPSQPAAPAQSGTAKMVPNMVFPQSVHSAPTFQPYYQPPTTGSQVAKSIVSAMTHSPVIGPAGGTLGNLWYGNPTSPWVPKHNIPPASLTPGPSPVPKPSLNQPSLMPSNQQMRWGNARRYP